MINPALGSSASRNLDDREARSRDFGGMIRKLPEAVAMPTSVAEVSSIVRMAAKNEVPLTIRGGGHSQGGQCLTDGGLVLDTTRLDRVQPMGRDLVRAQGGAEWGKVVDALRGTGRLPRILADIAEVTVGGTLSAGGLGTTSHRYGAQAGQIEQLEVVTGTGERVRCSRTRNSGLYDAVRGGQGQFGVITEAWIRLRKAGERLRQYQLRYRDSDRIAHDLERIVDEGRFDHVRVETRVHANDTILHAGVEYNEGHDDGQALEGLEYDEVAASRDTTEVGHAGMYPTWVFKRTNFHPWRDWIMPWEALPALLAQPWVNPQWVPQAPFTWTGMYPIGTAEIDAPLFMCPKGTRVLLYSILAVLHEYDKAKEMAARLKEIDRTLFGLGGKGYLSGAVGYGCKEWKEHYRKRLEMAIRWKKEFDPKVIFRGNAMPFGESP